MRIGIDARFLTYPQRGGFKSYTTFITSVLAETDHENDYILYTDRPAEMPFELPQNFTVKPVSGVNAIVREQIVLPSIMKRDKIDLAHFLCNTAPILGNIRMVVSILDAIPLRENKSNQPLNLKQRLLRAYWRYVMPRCARKADMVITISQYTGKDLLSYLPVGPEKIKVVPLSIDPIFSSDISGTKPSELTGSEEYIMAFASADGRKNHPSTISAYRSIANEYPGLKLVLVCAHPDLREQLKSENNAGVLPLGPVTIEELLWLYKNAKALVFPTYEEGFGLPPLEALACGTPVLASNNSSIPEVMGDAAVYIDPLDADGIARGIRQVLSDESLRKRLITAGFEQVSLFNRNQIGQRLSALYTDVINHRM